MEKVIVTFYPDQKKVELPRGETLLFAARSAGIPVDASCGGEGICGKCRMIVREGHVNMAPTALLSRDEIRKSLVLACISNVDSDCSVEIPQDSRVGEIQALPGEGHSEKITGLEKLEKEISYPFSPLCEKIFLELPPPSLNDSMSDLSRLVRGIREHHDNFSINISLYNISRLPALLRGSEWKVTAAAGNCNGNIEVIDIEEGDCSGRNYGAAVDIGTTTIAVSVVDLARNGIVETRAAYNPQASFGADVISRIIYAGKNGGLEQLQRVVSGAINRLISSICSENGISIHDVTCVVAAGNTTMMHLLLKLDPSYIRREPYIPVAAELPPVHAMEAGIFINPRGLLRCVPGVASYVGGDITSGVIASGLADSDEISFLMDIGTNGEVVLGCKDWLMCCSCSAGPAFEGGGIKCGMRASAGAIQEIKIDNGDISYRVIGDVKPRGICGSGLIDLVAGMMRNGLVNRAGRFTEKAGDRLRSSDEGMEFVVVYAGETASGEDVVFTEIDMENLLRAKGAMYVGARFLFQKAGLSFNDLSKFYIGGGFGNYINLKNAVTIGLLPDIDMDKFQFIGNSSLTGARLCLKSRKAFERAGLTARMMTNFELSVEPGFMNEFTSALFLPHTESDLFPNVLKELGWK
ncbi:MAG: ASKHA domain-containing protein [Chloroflexi bacterium]|nr:ASKHA domain-containing protein [Chloroflexota bacterium]